jgi:hypothetical protein
MLVIDGFFENGVFIPEKPISNVTGRQKASLKIDDTGNNKKEKTSAFGCLHRFANSSKIPGEKGAWERAAIESYAKN